MKSERQDPAPPFQCARGRDLHEGDGIITEIVTDATGIFEFNVTHCKHCGTEMSRPVKSSAEEAQEKLADYAAKKDKPRPRVPRRKTRRVVVRATTGGGGEAKDKPT